MGWPCHPIFVCFPKFFEAMSGALRIAEALAVALLIGVLPARPICAQDSSPEDALRQAMELQQAGDLEGAVKGYRQFLAARPKEGAVRANLGVLLVHLGRFDEATTEYKKALALD